ncbi:hypothetical protein [Paenibacillus vini]|uniref:Uncharacterized protein n=1 Tax=Paenibacillus vini TaxID=1476024 RepID=A0ABQ4MB93_9BACL|nr:hypothetical protein [Paenibacillus vini]GIP53251.1 hypothetical protein J42TS3_22860 [Paenibacillus vini]
MKEEKYFSELDRKIKNLPKPKIVPAICCWSDLLGFGGKFTENNWILGERQWSEVINRLVNVQTILARFLQPGYEYSLVLNDGIVRSYLMDNGIDHIQMLSLWLRSCVFFHNEVLESERKNKLPGLRTIIAAGDRAIHNWDDIKFSDYVYNYSKVHPSGLSSFERSGNNPTIMINPSPLQMNTAFSKAFILDEAGSKSGVGGASFYLDESFLKLLMYLSQEVDHCEGYIWDEYNDKVVFAIPIKGYGHLYHLGFELELPEINIDLNALKTKVYKVVSFFPHDEDPKEFKIEIF